MGSSYREFAASGQAELEAEMGTPEQRSAARRHDRWERCERAGIPIDQRYRVEGIEYRLRKVLGRQPTIGEIRRALEGQGAA